MTPQPPSPGAVEPYVMSGTHRFLSDSKTHTRFTQTNTYTLRWLDPFVLVLNVIGVHVLLPLVGLVWLGRRLTHAAPGLDPLRMAALLVATSAYAYLAGLANLFETPENMRYRQEVEPVIWLITLICITELATLLRRRTRADASPVGEEVMRPAGEVSLERPHQGLRLRLGPDARARGARVPPTAETLQPHRVCGNACAIAIAFSHARPRLESPRHRRAGSALSGCIASAAPVSAIPSERP